MKAMVLKAPGGVENLVLEEVPQPVAQSGEVLVEVKAVSINPVDIKTRKGAALYNSLKEEEPVILGWDISGVVAAVGAGENTFAVGDEVFGMVNFPGHGRAYAAYVAAPAAHLAFKPATITHEQAAACTLALLTAWQVLVQQAQLQKGETLLMQAAAGGVGHFAVQLARHLGATVIGTGSATNESFIKSLGADEFIDYTVAPFEEAMKDVDVVFDAVGGELPRRALATLKKGGRLVAIAGGVTEDVKSAAAERGVKAWPYLVQSNGADMQQLAQLLSDGIITPHLYKTFPFEEMRAAHTQIESGHTRGKVVLTLQEG